MCLEIVMRSLLNVQNATIPVLKYKELILERANDIDKSCENFRFYLHTDHRASDQ